MGSLPGEFVWGVCLGSLFGEPDLGTKVLREAKRQQRELEDEERAGRAPAGKDLLAAAVQRAQQRDASSDEDDALSEDEPEDGLV